QRLPLPTGRQALEGLIDGYYQYVEAHPFAYRMYFRDTEHRDIQMQGVMMLAALLATVPGFEDADQATLEMATEVLRAGLIGLARGARWAATTSSRTARGGPRCRRATAGAAPSATSGSRWRASRPGCRRRTRRTSRRARAPSSQLRTAARACAPDCRRRTRRP